MGNSTSLASPAETRKNSRRKGYSKRLWICFGLVILFVIAAAFMNSLTTGLWMASRSAVFAQVNAISHAMYSYASDHGGKYPEGMNSTEVFQRLLDGGYVTNPGLFFYPSVAGKTRAKPSQKQLKSENVCFDITAGLNPTGPDSDTVPLVFLTGYRITYAAGVLPAPLDRFREAGGIPLCYADGRAIWLDGSIGKFIPSNFDAHGKTYRQLTPEGFVK